MFCISHFFSFLCAQIPRSMAVCCRGSVAFILFFSFLCVWIPGLAAICCGGRAAPRGFLCTSAPLLVSFFLPRGNSTVPGTAEQQEELPGCPRLREGHLPWANVTGRSSCEFSALRVIDAIIPTLMHQIPSELRS